MKILLPILVLMTGLTASAQKFSVEGQLTDTLDNPLPSATVLLLNPKDSSLVNFVVGDSHGKFQIRNVNRGDHLIKVTFIGLKPFVKKIATPQSGTTLDLGVIRMEPASHELDAIEIKAEKAPVVVRNDTIEFNAESFKTQPNAVVEDLLKQLPGVEVDPDGNIMAQGEQVRRVTVDGKNFFGTDPKLATKNLPADAVDKVQVFDKKSDQARFSGIDDGQREKTINLELKEEKRNGAFGTLMAGAGTDDRFQGRANLNRFTKERQISFLGMANNVNVQGFSMDDYLNFTGGAQRLLGGGGTFRVTINRSSDIPLNFGNRANGILSNYAGGLNLNNQFNEKTELNASYFYNHLDHARNESTVRDNFLPTGTYTYGENSVQQNTNDNHRLNFTLDQKIDSANSLKLTGSASYNRTNSHVTGSSSNILNDNTTISESDRSSVANGINSTFNSSLLWRHRFPKKGRTFSSTLSMGLTDNARDGLLDATNRFFGDDPGAQTLHQSSTQANDALRYGASLVYTEPLGGRKYLEANYHYERNMTDVQRLVYDLDGELSDLNEGLSNDYTSDYQYHRGGLNFRLNHRKYNFVVGGSMQRTFLRGNLNLQSVGIDRDFENFLPSLRFDYNFTSTRRLGFDYETSVQEPDIQQLQPIIDNSDPLNLYVGNPELRPAYTQSWRLDFTTFDPGSFISFFAFMDVQYITNAITNAQTIDERLVRTVTPVNVDDNMRINGNVTFSFPVNAIKSRFSLSGNFRNMRTVNLLNAVATSINQQVAGGTLRYSFRHAEVFDLSLSADLDHQLTKYEFNQPGQIFVNSTYTAQASVSFLKNLRFATDFDYLTYESEGMGYRQHIPLLNLSLSAFMLKDKSGELKISVNNLLDRALGVSQTASVNYIERQTINSLGRYFMLSFTYSLNKHLSGFGMGGRGGRIRIMR